MAQPSQVVPTVVMNVAGNKQQVNLRDYLNVRVAPFLKRAINESLGVEAEYPLQWLGEQLIQQSILYEGNPDATNIRERFAYNHEIPEPEASSISSNPPQIDPVTVSEQAPQNDTITTNGIAAEAAQSTPEAPSHTEPNQPLAATGQEHEQRERDVEMGGTS